MRLVGKRLHDLPTPALYVEVEALRGNLQRMSEALPGDRLRPHVKAHKCSELARLQAQQGNRGFTCATTREMVGLAGASLGDDLLLANESVDPVRLAELAGLDARVTVAVDSLETIEAAASAGISEVLIDVNVGLPRCGCDPALAGRLADTARRRGLGVRGVMGYEGHVVGEPDRFRREQGCTASMEILRRAHEAVGGDVVSAGGTGTFDCNTIATEIQAGSYALMDSAYSKLDLPFAQALFLEATVISIGSEYAVADCGLKALGMDHGLPSIANARVLFCSDEHVTFVSSERLKVGDRVRVEPAHCDPTVAYHERLFCIDGETVVDCWDVDLRGW